MKKRNAAEKRDCSIAAEAYAAETAIAEVGNSYENSIFMQDFDGTKAGKVRQSPAEYNQQ